MKTITFHENLSASENHKGWTMRIDRLRVGEIYPQDEDGLGGRLIVAGLQEREVAHARLLAENQVLLKFVTDVRDSAEDAFGRGRQLDRDKIEADANALLKSIAALQSARA